MAKRSNKKITLTYLFLIILLLAFISFVYISYYDNSNAIKVSNEELRGIKISFLDVGQADSILVQVDNENMLIDAGNNNDGKNIVDYLNKQNITNFKYVIGTHAHEDHIGGMDNIIQSFNIEHFYMPDVITTTKTFEDVLDSLENKKIRFETPNIDDKLNLGEALIDIIYVGNDDNNLNNTSIVLKITYKNMKFLFTGDIEKDIEKELLNKDISANILKVAHHGSSTSSSKSFIKKVSPEYAIISVGKNNSYNHPNKSTLDTLNEYNIKTLRTDELGTIILSSDGEKINYYNIRTNIDGK